MNKLFIIYGIIIPLIIITSMLNRLILIGWFVTMSVIALFHDFLFTNKTSEGLNYE